MQARDYQSGRKPDSPGSGGAAITPADSDLAQIAVSLYVEGAGAIKMTFFDDTVDTWNVPANFLIPMAVKRVWSTGTTATGIHAIY